MNTFVLIAIIINKRIIILIMGRLLHNIANMITYLVQIQLGFFAINYDFDKLSPNDYIIYYLCE